MNRMRQGAWSGCWCLGKSDSLMTLELKGNSEWQVCMEMRGQVVQNLCEARKLDFVFHRMGIHWQKFKK